MERRLEHGTAMAGLATSPGSLPRVLNPSQGYVAVANQRTTGRNNAIPLGHQFATGWRAQRIARLLDKTNGASEVDMLRAQLDVDAGFFAFYHNLAIDAIHAQGPHSLPRLNYELSWDGTADANDRQIHVLLEFRRLLADRLLSPMFQRCSALDADFSWVWLAPERPLRELLALHDVSLIPKWRDHATWDAFVIDCLADAIAAADRNGDYGHAQIRHPLSTALPSLASWLDMPHTPLPGTAFCPRYFTGVAGASERMVVSPGAFESGVLHIPCGQSGNPFSANYRDQHGSWESGAATPFLSGTAVRMLILEPH
jgi:penicillin amidase